MRFRFLVVVGALAVAVPGAGARPVSHAVPVGQIAYWNAGTIYVIDSRGRDRHAVATNAADEPPAWSPDGRLIAYTRGPVSARSGKIAEVRTDGTAPRMISGDAADACCPTWSPDGSEVAFSASEGETYAILVASVGTSAAPRQLTRLPSSDWFDDAPDWSPDGRWILFERSLYGSPVTRLMVVHPDGSELHEIARLYTGSYCICGDWSPDGARIAYEAGSNHPLNELPELYVMNADGSTRVRLTHNRVIDENPDWSPDGRLIAFYTGRAGNAEIWIARADGSNPSRVTHDSGNSRFPRWQPRPR